MLKSFLPDPLSVNTSVIIRIVKNIKKTIGFIIDYHIFVHKNKNAIA